MKMIFKCRKKSTIVLLVLVVSLIFASSNTISEASTDNVINVKDFGAAGDGVTDDTTAFQSAIAQSTLEKKPVFVPFGTYKITQTLNLTNQSMIGEMSAAWGSDDVNMPVIKPTNPANSGIRLNKGGAISGLAFDYDQNEASSTPTQYAPTILLAGVGTRISNVKITHAWIAIDCVDSPNANTGRTAIENVFISKVAKVGIDLDYGWDVTTLHNVEVWTPSTIYNGYFLNNGTGIILRHNDMLRVSNTFVFGAQVGMLFEDNENNVGTWGVLTNSSVDYCLTGIKFVGMNKLTIAGGSFWAHFKAFDVDTAYTELNISACDIRSNGDAAFYIGDCKHITISSCVITRDMQNYTNPAIHIAGGWNVVITGNYIKANGTGVIIGSGARRAIVSNNIIEVPGGTSVSNNGMITVVKDNININ